MRRFYARKVLVKVGKQHARDALTVAMVQSRVCDVVQVREQEVGQLTTTGNVAAKLKFPTTTPTINRSLPADHTTGWRRKGF